ncbi:conserved protein of unknown function [Xenorhabdus poinarii G6]|uniref:Transposase n=1 Tax=Xenorhabdus poinarii G6 TaxID=1354304 RepID=A0A068QYQ3_9GAMM|nr:conserved protein of unknown function [Xenorhabdus poinarii G6]
MNTPAYRRHDISDHIWNLLGPHLPGRKGVWEALLEHLISEPDFEWLMMDASHIKVHPHVAGAKGGESGYGTDKNIGGV